MRLCGTKISKAMFPWTSMLMAVVLTIGETFLSSFFKLSEEILAVFFFLLPTVFPASFLRPVQTVMIVDDSR